MFRAIGRKLGVAVITGLITNKISWRCGLNFRVWGYKTNTVSHTTVVASMLLALAASSSASADPIETSMYGAQDHMSNSDGSGYNPNYSMPVQKTLNGHWIRDGITALAGATVNLPSDSAAAKQNVANNRAILNSYLSVYDNSGMRLIFTIIAMSPRSSASYIAYNADFLNLVSQMVTDHPSIYALELHNEPFIGSSWGGTPEDYTNIYRPFADAAHKARAGLKVLGCGGCNYYYNHDNINRMFAAGLMDFIDGVSLHPYNGAFPGSPLATQPEVDSLYASHGNWEASQIHLFNDIYQAFNTTRKPFELDFTEMGYASVPGSSGSPDEPTQAAYLSRLMIESQDLRVKGIPLNAAIWYDFMNDHNPRLDSTPNQQHNFGLYNFDLSSYKPAFTAYRTVINGFPDNSDIVAAPAGVSAVANMNASAVSTRVWQRKSDGAIVVPFWRLDQITSVTADFSAYLTVTMPNSSKIMTVTVDRACGVPAHPKFTQKGTSIAFQVSFDKCASWATIK